MPTRTESHEQSGFSIVEVLIVITVMLIVLTSVFGLMKSSVMLSLTTYEMTDAQESLRISQEFINRDLIEAGDGLKGINNICVRTNFVTNFLTKNSASNSCGTNMVTLPLVQSDNDVPANTPIALTSLKVRSTPALTDRINMLQRDSTFKSVTVAATAIPSSGATIAVSTADFPRFNIGEIYFITSAAGATFGTITGKDATAKTLSFATGDTYGLNNAVSGGPISMVSGGGTQAATIMRMRIIHYYVDENGLLTRRVFGVDGGNGYTDTVIAEHIIGLYFRYILDSNGSSLAQQPVNQLTTPQQQTDVRQVEVTVIAETTHQLANGQRQPLSMTTTTSVRNLQFVEALQP